MEMLHPVAPIAGLKIIRKKWINACERQKKVLMFLEN